MGCAQSKSPEEEALTRNSREIDRFLKADGRYLADQVKVLLLGIGESGKSTVFKQCKLLQDETSGFSDVEVLSFLPAIHNNILSQMALLCYQARVDGQRLGCAEAEAFSEKILAGWREPLTPETASHVKTLWSDPVIRHLASQQSNSFHLNDSATYFFEQVDRVAAPGYLPSTADILRCRIASTGIEEAEFLFEDLQFRMFDVGGQRSERRKWIHCFECVTAVLYVASLVGYHQVLREDESQNCMKESLLLFEELYGSPWFRNASFILFLNKTDLFKERIKDIPITVAFPGYTGPQKEEPSLAYIAKAFQDRTLTSPGRRELFIHRTCAIDTDQIKIVFLAVRKTLLDQILKTSGIPL